MRHRTTASDMQGIATWDSSSSRLRKCDVRPGGPALPCLALSWKGLFVVLISASPAGGLGQPVSSSTAQPRGITTNNPRARIGRQAVLSRQNGATINRAITAKPVTPRGRRDGVQTTVFNESTACHPASHVVAGACGQAKGVVAAAWSRAIGWSSPGRDPGATVVVNECEHARLGCLARWPVKLRGGGWPRRLDCLPTCHNPRWREWEMDKVRRQLRQVTQDSGVT